jgi:hypothetical protein
MDLIRIYYDCCSWPAAAADYCCRRTAISNHHGCQPLTGQAGWRLHTPVVPVPMSSPSCSLLAAARGIISPLPVVCVSEASAILVCGGEPLREELAARMASAATGPLADAQLFISSGMYRKVADFNPDNDDNPHRVAMRDVDFARLRPRLHLDRQAVDTVGNFTTMVGMLAEQGHTRVVLVTSAEHMRRAAMCAAIVLGSYSISFATVACRGAAAAESLSYSSGYDRRSRTRRSDDSQQVHSSCQCQQGCAGACRAARTRLTSCLRRVLCCCRCCRCLGADGHSSRAAMDSDGTTSEGWLRTLRDGCRCVMWVLTGWDGATVARWVHPHRN